MPVRNIVLILSALSQLSACATWDAPATYHDWKLPAPNTGEGTVVFEVAFIRWPELSADEAVKAEKGTGEFWRALDEQFLEPELRQHLAANGLRAGILSDPIPEAIREALDATRDPLSVISEQNATSGAEVLTRRERRQCPSGSNEEIEVLPLREGRRVVLVHESGRVRAQQFDQPRGYFRFTTHAIGDGAVRVDLLPIIDFGEARQRIIGGQGAYRYDTRRDQQVYESLKISTSLMAGRTLVITSTADKKGLGATLFADRFEGSSDRLLILLRIAESHRDELFAPRTQQESLVTPLK